jgi:hypothetical protein
VWEHCTGALFALQAARSAFYVGISEDPSRRWAEHADRNHWQGMIVICEAASSRETAALERRLLSWHSTSPLCRNVGRGGERPSAGRPHYLYVLHTAAGSLNR